MPSIPLSRAGPLAMQKWLISYDDSNTKPLNAFQTFPFPFLTLQVFESLSFFPPQLCLTLFPNLLNTFFSRCLWGNLSLTKNLDVNIAIENKIKNNSNTICPLQCNLIKCSNRYCKLPNYLEAISTNCILTLLSQQREQRTALTKY